MLLNQIAKHAFEKDAQVIRRAVQHIDNITEYINEQKREAEDLEMVCKETKQIHIKSGKAVVCIRVASCGCVDDTSESLTDHEMGCARDDPVVDCAR